MAARSFESIARDDGRTPHDEVDAENGLRLIHYEPLADQIQDVPIVLVSPFINKPYILDLHPDRSVVRVHLEAG
ncbi:hypothetical protein [Natrinema halophilum]|uniref:hypothetical protein n=1 Tax=Natrinema halophilum TaxID=1699371 RepID=UPI001F439116|nr:hypothetical protein [Natrinema halophilum]UHQ96081.1 hypothetical protein HYG82_22390 [Natrinema halophilum]